MPAGGAEEADGDDHHGHGDEGRTSAAAPASGVVHWDVGLDESHPVGTMIPSIDSAGSRTMEEPA